MSQGRVECRTVCERRSAARQPRCSYCDRASCLCARRPAWPRRSWTFRAAGIGAAQDASWVPARARDDRAFVRTGPASKMALVFADETQVRLNQNSLLQVALPAAQAQRRRCGWSSDALVAGEARSDGQLGRRLRRQRSAAPRGARSRRGGHHHAGVIEGSVEFFNALGSVTVAPTKRRWRPWGKHPCASCSATLGIACSG
jgi:hypothetical protein